MTVLTLRSTYIQLTDRHEVNLLFEHPLTLHPLT
jgi:hypothetical protein